MPAPSSFIDYTCDNHVHTRFGGHATGELEGTLLCHLDGALGYVLEIIPTDIHYQMIDQLLQEAGIKGLALEINTSGMTIRRAPFPSASSLWHFAMTSRWC